MQKSLLMLWLLLSFFGSIQAQNLDIQTEIEKISAEVKARYCPDTRVAVWEVKVIASDSTLQIKGETDNPAGRDEFLRLVKEKLPQVAGNCHIVLLPDETMGNESYGIVINSVETMRSGPSVFKDIVSQTLRGLPVRVLKRESGYVLIKTDDDYLGWVDADRIVIGDADFLNKWHSGPRAVYDRLEGVVYTRPHWRSQPLADVVLGNRFKVGRSRFIWTEVIFPDGRRGWVPKRFLVGEEEYQQRRPVAQEVIATARLFLGRPYLWGAASPKALDCSGFMQTIFRRHGLLLPRDANMQVTTGNAVDTTALPQHLQPGDLLFFGPRPEKITHTGLYIGAGKFIHSSGEVKINSFLPADPEYSAYLRRNLRAVRRVITPSEK